MSKISCNVCIDLMPLVKDNVASEDSVELVSEHVADCEQCKDIFMQESIVNAPMNSVKVLGKIKAKLTLILLAIIIGGALFGMILSNGSGLFYNALIFPLIGGLGYLFFRKRWYVVPIGLFILTFIWTFLRGVFDNYLTTMSIPQMLMMSLPWAFLFSVLAVIGGIIGWLLCYAFKREEK